MFFARNTNKSAIRQPRVKAPQLFVSGLALVAVGMLVLSATGQLSLGTLRQFGPGMLPRWLAVGIVLFGSLMVFQSFRIQGEPLERWHLRAPVFVLLGIALFGLTLERFGLLVAGPLTVFAAGFGLERVRFRELLIFALFISVVCAGLFRYLLKQPIPLLSIDTLGIFL